MRFKNLSQLKRPQIFEKTLGSLPQKLAMTSYAGHKAFKICELVAAIFQESYEWYGFTLAEKARPELVVDIGLPRNDLNLSDYATLGGDTIAAYQETLPHDLIINGWIHSHGALHYKSFSNTDADNHRTVLNFVAAGTRRPLAKRQIAIQDLQLLVKDSFTDEDLRRGSVALITDAPITEARILETIYGSFCYCVVVGDGGWHNQEIHYREKGILSGYTKVGSRAADLLFIDTDKTFTRVDIDLLTKEVEEKIRPNLNPPLETMERM
ncbi:hypothetical protein [Desulfoferrobacter suflitae]|uniref:hypothetical protein n=1 Tax=Desulfoferrobacter suflitae TaxID=2865782 RepID=UPI0021649802|nr:hypothetical protein [Desulfoferrobacter suflitae]MCK8602235.1 hypothetical protein [Desulfoferrobacter suflitae]